MATPPHPRPAGAPRTAGPPDPAAIRYEAESPDEAALVVAAKVFGFFFFKRTNTTLVSPLRASLGGPPFAARARRKWTHTQRRGRAGTTPLASCAALQQMGSGFRGGTRCTLPP